MNTLTAIACMVLQLCSTGLCPVLKFILPDENFKFSSPHYVTTLQLAWL